MDLVYIHTCHISFFKLILLLVHLPKVNALFRKEKEVLNDNNKNKDAGSKKIYNRCSIYFGLFWATSLSKCLHCFIFSCLVCNDWFIQRFMSQWIKLGCYFLVSFCCNCFLKSKAWVHYSTLWKINPLNCRVTYRWKD